MDAVGRVVPVLPVPLMATVFVRFWTRLWPELERKAEAGRMLDALDAKRWSTCRAAISTTPCVSV